jgi:hypothetical protein
VTLYSGKVLDGPLSGLEAVPVRLGDQSLSVNLAKAAEVRLAPAIETDQMWYTLLVRQGKQEIFRQTGSLLIEGFLPMPVGAPGLTGIKRPILEKNPSVRKLPAPVTDVAVGGAGRFLVLHLASLGKLAVFDVSSAEVVGYIPAKDDNARFAAGLEHVVVLLPGAGKMERWSLKTLEREVAAPLAIQGAIKAAAMGCASTGPLLVHWGPVRDGNMCGFAHVSVNTMKLVQSEIPLQTPHMVHLLTPQVLLHVRAAANGKVFGMWTTSHSTGVGVIVVSDAGFHSY